MNEFFERITKLSPKRLQLLAVELQTKLESLERQRSEPVAVIGMACRFPGGANDPESFWQLLRNGVDAITEVPGDRWDVNAYYDPDPDAPGKMSSRWGGFLKNVDKFDPQFFGISPREAASMDPQQRLLLEVSWEALEHAGQSAEKLDGTPAGVFVGICNNDYSQLLLDRGPQAIDAYLASGSAHSVAAGRLSYFLGLHGPNLAVDTACSSSLVALHLAVQSLRNGECRAALAGGVNLILAPDVTIALSKAHMMASDGRCKAFAAEADGFVRGEGCGVVVLKRLSDAIADGDTILALVRGSAVNQDGRSNGLTAPNGPSQEAVIRAALANAGVEPDEVSYVETHGTGTSLGDPIEVKALGAVLGAGRPAAKPLMIGSVKTNVGHLEAAAGVVGFIKVVLALQHQEVPPHLHLKELNPFIPWNELPVTIPAEPALWTGKRIAGLSAFGFSGTNAHLIVEEAPAAEPAKAGVERPLHLLALSAKSEVALKELARQFSKTPGVSLADVCFTANAGRAHFTHRLAVVADSSAQLHGKLNDFIVGKIQHSVVKTTPEAAFLFTGQGAQYAGMGRQLYETQPTFRRTLDKCDEILRPYLNQSLVSLLYPEVRAKQSGGDSNERQGSAPAKRVSLLLDQTAYTQPALFAIEYALAELWRSWGVEPTVVLGHSVGEYVAACVAGVFSLEDGLKLIAERGRLMGALPAGGEMAAVFADEEQVEKAIAPHAETVSIAAVNGPANVVISGAGEAVQAIVKNLEAEGVKSKRLTVSHAFHSPLMEPMLAEFERVAKQVSFNAPRISFISNVSGQPVREAPDAAYWHRHIMATVRFAAAIQAAREQGPEIFLEIGPGTTLLGMGQACLPEVDAAWLPSLRKGRNDWEQMLESLGALYVRGLNVDWTGFDRDYAPARRKASLPTYPFQRQRYWFEGGGRRSPALASEQPAQVSFADWLYEIEWQPQLRTDRADFLPAPDEIAKETQLQVAELRAHHHMDVYNELLPKLNALCAAYAAHGLSKLGWEWQIGQRLSAEALMKQLPVMGQHRRLVGRMLEMMGEDGFLEQAGSEWEVRRLPESRDPNTTWQALLNDYPAHRAELTLTGQCASQLAEVLQGKVDPLQLLFPGGSLTDAENLYQNSPSSQMYNTLMRETVSAALARLPTGRRARILEIGGGTGGTTSYVLPKLPADQTNYVFTDVSPLFTDKARQKFVNYPFVQYKVLDIGKEPERQGVEAGQFDLILAANVLHATSDLRQTLRHVQQLLAPGGLLVLLEGTAPQRFGDLTVGLTEGWWSFTDTDLRPSYALMPQARWLKLLAESGFVETAILPEAADVNDVLSQQAVILARGPQAAQAAMQQGNWLVFADEGGVGRQLAERLRARGAQATLALPGAAYERTPDGNFKLDPARPEDFERLFRESSYRGVVHLWALDATQTEAVSPAELDEAQIRGTASALHLAQALAKAGNSLAGLWLVTRGAQAAGGPSQLAVVQSPVWGLGGVIALEHPELNCMRVDLDALDPAAQVETLVEEILARDPKEDQIALRGQARYTRKLARGAVDEAAATAAPTAFRSDAAYLITGGLSGLGLLAAEWMVKRGARHLVLMGRRGPSEATRATLEKLTQAGAQIVVAQADVSRRDQVEGVLADIEKSGLPLAGVIHSAGVLDDGVLLQQNWERFRRVMAAKVDGAWNLHLLTRNLPLDFFILFSSGVSLLGRMGQSNHAAANAFMDALAHHRRAQGLPALSINWGAWAEVGSVVTHHVGELITTQGLGIIKPEQGLQVLDYLMRQADPQVAVMPVNWPVLLSQFPNGTPPLLSKFAGEMQAATKIERAATAEPGLRQQLAGAPPNQRRAVLLDHVRAQAVKVLRLDPSQIDSDQPLNQLGLDSLMAVELRNVLSQSVERTLPATLLFDHPSVNALTDYLGRDLIAEVTEKPKTGARRANETPKPSPERDHLSEDELAALLAQKLKRIG